MNNKDFSLLDDAIGCVFRHNRIFNYLVSPVNIDLEIVKCHIGRNQYRDIPLDYFKRDWKKDTNINYDDLVDKLSHFSIDTSFTAVYDEFYEFDDGKPHSYIHFKDDISEKIKRFPMWHLTTCNNTDRKKIINPYTMIMPIIDGLEEQVKKELEIINNIRYENEFIKIDDFRGFEFGLIKILEKKYLRVI